MATLRPLINVIGQEMDRFFVNPKSMILKPNFGSAVHKMFPGFKIMVNELLVKVSQTFDDSSGDLTMNRWILLHNAVDG